MTHPTHPSNAAGIAWSPPQAHGAEVAAWWSQRVVFDGQPVRRIDLFHTLAVGPGRTKAEVRTALETAPPADGNAALKSPWYWSRKVYFNGRPTTRREARVVLEAHRVPERYIAEFLDTAQVEVLADQKVEEDEGDDLILDGEEDAILRSAQYRPDRLTADDKKRLEEIEQERDALMSRKSVG